MEITSKAVTDLIIYLSDYLSFVSFSFFFFFFEDFNRLLLDFRENTPSLFHCYRSGDVNKTLFWLCGFFVHAMEHHTRRDETLKNGCHPP